MKKLLGFFVAALLIFGLAGQGMAAFADLNLFRTIYDSSAGQTTEVGSNLGSNTFSTAGAYGTNVNVGDLVSKGSFVGGVADLKISYYGFKNGTDPDRDYWVTSTVATGLNMLGRKQTDLDNAFKAVAGVPTYYNSLGSGSTVTGSTAVINSYFGKVDGNGTAIGSFTGAVSVGVATVSLADLAGPNHYVDTYLYYFDYNGSGSTKAGTLVATIRTYMTKGADGNFATLGDNMIGSTINPSAAPVPIPPSVLLLGAGLLGLIGIRRRKA